MADVHLPSSLVALFPGAPRRLRLDAGTVAELIDRLDERWPGVRNRLCDAGPVIRRHIRVFVDGEPAHLQTGLAPDSEVHIIPSISGGAEGFSRRIAAEGMRWPNARGA